MPLGTEKTALLGAAGGGAENYFGDGSDGSLTTSGSVSYVVNTTTRDMTLKQYTQLTVSSGHTITTDVYSRGIFIYVTGNCTITGTIALNGGSASANSAGATIAPDFDPATNTASSDGSAVSSTGLRLPMFTASGSDTLAAADFAGCGTAVVNAVANQEGISGDGTTFGILRNGGAGGAASGASGGFGTISPGNTGTAGTTSAAQISSGGGGCGGKAPEGVTRTSGAGGTGSCFGGGGASGGSSGSSPGTSGDASWSRGAPGATSGPGWGGQPSGHGGEGAGTIILVVGGDLTMTGSITCNAGGGGNGKYS